METKIIKFVIWCCWALFKHSISEYYLSESTPIHVLRQNESISTWRIEALLYLDLSQKVLQYGTEREHFNLENWGITIPGYLSESTLIRDIISKYKNKCVIVLCKLIKSVGFSIFLCFLEDFVLIAKANKTFWHFLTFWKSLILEGTADTFLWKNTQFWISCVDFTS